MNSAGAATMAIACWQFERAPVSGSTARTVGTPVMMRRYSGTAARTTDRRAEGRHECDSIVVSDEVCEGIGWLSFTVVPVLSRLADEAGLWGSVSVPRRP